jgi:hypothetical protein
LPGLTEEQLNQVDKHVLITIIKGLPVRVYEHELKKEELNKLFPNGYEEINPANFTFILFPKLIPNKNDTLPTNTIIHVSHDTSYSPNKRKDARKEIKLHSAQSNTSGAAIVSFFLYKIQANNNKIPLTKYPIFKSSLLHSHRNPLRILKNMYYTPVCLEIDDISLLQNKRFQKSLAIPLLLIQ